MFYYLKVAEYIASGAGSTFDGVSPTNGYHPLWMLLCVLLAFVFSGDMLVHAALTLTALLHVAQGMMLARILGRFLRPWLIFALVAIYLLNWRTLSVNLCGLETSLATFAALLVMDRLTAGPVAAPRAAAGLGLRGGLAVLARFDLLLLLGYAMSWVGLDRRPGAAASFARRVILAAIAGLVALALLLPWFVFSWQVSGTLLPNSRHAVRLLTGLAYDTRDPAQMLGLFERQIWSYIWWSSDIGNLFGIFPGLAPGGKGMLLAAVAVGSLAAGVPATLLVFRARPEARTGLAVMGYVAIHAGYYLVFHRIELRYILPALALFFIPLGIALELVLQRAASLRAERLCGAALALAFLCATATGIGAFRHGYASNRAHMHHYVAQEAALWLAREKPGAVAAAWNAGVLGYYSETGLVNLDGVINDDALAAAERRRLWEFIRARGVEFIVEEPGQIEDNLDRFAGTDAWRAELGPPVRVFEDAEGRLIVVRPVLPPQEAAPIR